jgi:hypothetical protein
VKERFYTQEQLVTEDNFCWWAWGSTCFNGVHTDRCHLYFLYKRVTDANYSDYQKENERHVMIVGLLETIV